MSLQVRFDFICAIICSADQSATLALPLRLLCFDGNGQAQLKCGVYCSPHRLHAPNSSFLRADRGNAVISITAATRVAFLSYSSSQR